MKKFITGRVPLILVGIALLILNVVFWPIVGPKLDGDTIKSSLWVGYGFLTGAFVIVGATTFIKIHNKNVVTSLAPIFLVTMSYFVLAIILNVICMIINTDEIIAQIVINAVLILLFVAALIIAYKHFSRVNDNTAKREERMEGWRMVSINISSLLAFATDEEVKAALKKLKENVDYSSSHGNEKTKAIEEELNEQIITIKSMLKNGSEKDTTLKAIAVAEALLKNRNQFLMVTK